MPSTKSSLRYQTNFLEETIKAMLPYTPNQVLWVGTSKWTCSWDDFAKAANINNTFIYGLQYVPMDLVIVGDGWWLERQFGDDAEVWLLCQAPTKSPVHKEPSLNDLYTGSPLAINFKTCKNCQYSLLNPDNLRWYCCISESKPPKATEPYLSCKNYEVEPLNET